MIKKVFNFLFSIKFMGLLFFIFAISLAVATFIENDFGSTVSRAVVYNAWWFNVLLSIMAINLIGALFYYKMFKVKKITIIIFHIAFVFMVLGAGVTRFCSSEGVMHIRENKIENKIYSFDNYLKINLSDNTNNSLVEEKILFIDNINDEFNKTYKIGDKSVSIKLKNIIPNASEQIVETNNGKPLLLFKVFSANGTKIEYIEYNNTKNIEGTELGFNQTQSDLNFLVSNDTVFLFSKKKLEIVDQDGPKEYQGGKKHIFESGKLYKINDDVQMSFRWYYPSAEVQYQSLNEYANYSNILTFEISNNKIHQTVNVKHIKGKVGEYTKTNINGVEVRISYGAKITTLPFALKLDDFILDRYAGSMSPSSYKSKVTLIDETENIHEHREIFMNNVLKYKGYKFYQSSYDEDEKGTILSVNNDTEGTILTYIGYFLMILGMILSVFNKNSRLHFLAKKVRESSASKASIIIMLIGLSTISFSAKSSNDISVEHAEKFGSLLVQNNEGRIEPLNTLTGKVLRKISYKSSFDGLNAEQIFLGIMIDPQKWSDISFIKVKNDRIKHLLNINDKYASFTDFVTINGEYKLRKAVEEAYSKKPSERNTFDKDIIKVDERLNIFYLVSQGELLKLFPDYYGKEKKWIAPIKNTTIYNKDSVFVKTILGKYVNALTNAAKTNDYSQADKLLSEISDYQKKYAGDLYPSQAKTNLEIIYNKLGIFLILAKYYGMIGFVLLILLFIKLLSNKNLKWPIIISELLIVLLFVIHIIGIIMRWYISGHAPWSNGYESMIYIGFATLLAGIIFAKRTPITLAVASILASIILMVAHLSWMDPQITNLVPVLKSYWLTIHVSVITASYGFLALGALLGFLNLFLNLFKTKSNIKVLNNKIEELTYINEMTLIIGLYLLTIGTFLGGIWANESWGRYWGWDPKETWSLITILVYSFVIHMRYIPSFKGKFSFNFASILAFASVIMTYFGVNYYLSGLHSYAQGDAVPIPVFAYYTLLVILVVSAFSYFTDRRYRIVTGK